MRGLVILVAIPLAIIVAALLVPANDGEPPASGDGAVPEAQAGSPETEMATLAISSDPPGARVRVASTVRGVTPLEVEVPVGHEVEYTVVAEEPYESHNLYEPYTGRVAIESDTSIDVWIPRTTAEEQQAQLEAHEASRRESLRMSLLDSPWTYRERKDPITDADTSYVRTKATRYPQLADDAYLMIRCDQDDPTAGQGVAILVFADEYLNNGESPVDWRTEGAQAVEGQMWRNSTEGTSVFNVEFKTQFLRALLGADSLYFRVRDFRGTRHDYEFAVSNARAALQALGCYTGAALE